MAERYARTTIDPDFVDGGPLIPQQAWRFLVWGGSAFVATLLVMVAAWTQVGSQRLAELRVDGARSLAGGPSQSRKSAEAEAEMRRLALALRDLANDRDRLLSRIGMLERNLEEVTGSVTGSLHPASRSQAVGPAASPLPPAPLLGPMSVPTSAAAQSAAAIAPQIAPPMPAPSASRQSGQTAQDPSPPVQVHAALPSAARPMPQAAATPSQSDTPVSKTEFGIDLGGDVSIDGLRSLWMSLRGNHSALLEGLRPVVAIREGQKPSILELRLVAGPLANAAAAARYCAALAVSGIACQPTVFDGQRLALR